MKLDAYIQANHQAYQEAKDHVENSEVKQYREILRESKWEDFIARYGKPIEEQSPQRQSYKAASEFLAKELAEPIAIALIHRHYSEPEFFRQLNDAEEKLHYRFLAVLGREPHEADGGWVSKHLARHHVLEEITRQSGSFGRELCSRARGIGFLMDQEGMLANKLYDLPIGKRVVSFFDDHDEKRKFQPVYQDFAENAPPQELLSILLSMASKADGLRPNMPIDNIINHVVAEAAIKLYKNPNIGISDIARLKEQGVIKPTIMWDTSYYNKVHAPVLTDDYVARVRAQVTGKFQDEVFLELKDKLTDQQIMGYLMRGSRTFETESWLYAMAAFEVHTGKRLTFQEARDLKPEYNFALSSTQPHSDRTDRLMDAEDFKKITVQVERAKDQDHKYDHNQKAVSVWIDSKSLSVESISEAIQKEIARNPAIREFATTQDGVWYELAISARDTMGEAKSIAKQLQKTLESLQATTVLPGDIIKINHEEVEEYGLKNGNTAQVTDVDMFGTVKLKGDPHYYPAELFEIKRKFQPEVKSGLSM